MTKQKNNSPVVFIENPGLLLFSICLITAIAFFPALKNDFTNWDDDTHLTDNVLVRSLHFDTIKEIFTTSIHKTYIPLTILSYALEYRFFEYQPFVYHFTNLVLHLLIVSLVFILAFRLGLDARGAAVAALIFGIHPMHVESVAWVTERKDVLYGLFYLLALYFYVRYKNEGRGKFYFLSMLSGFLSILAKPMALSLPLILLLYDLFSRRGNARKMVFEKIPYFLFIIPIALITYRLHARIPGGEFFESVLMWVWTFSFYLKTFFAPFVLVPLYAISKPISLGNFQYVLALLIFGTAVFLVIRYRSHRWFLFAFLYFFLSIFFLLRFDTISDINVVADRFMYLPSVGICFFLGFCFQTLYNKNVVWQRAALISTFIIIVLLSFKTFQQCRIWQNSYVLWSYVIRHNPEASIAYNNRGYDYLKKENFQKALADFDKALSLNGENYEAINNKGLVYSRLGNYEKAIENFNRTLELKPDNEKTYNNRGIAYQDTENFDLAFADYSKALKINPRYVESYVNRGNLYNIIGKYDPALEDYRKVLQWDPDNFYAHYGIGMVYLLAERRYDHAIEKFNKVLQLNPRYERAYFYRSVAYRNLGNLKAALEDALHAEKLGFTEPGYIEQLRAQIEK